MTYSTHGLLVMSVLVLLGLPAPGFAAETAVEAVTTETIAANEKDIIGKYYFKSLRLMEIRREGDTLVTELYGAKKDWALREKNPDGEWLPWSGPPVHQGRLIDPNVIEFANFPFTAENYWKHGSKLTKEEWLKLFGNEQRDVTKLDKYFGEFFALGRGVNYYERWRLLPGGKLRMETAFPITPVGPGPRRDEFLTAIDDKGSSAVLFTPSDDQEICGWKIADPREIQAWDELKRNDFKQAAALFHAAAQARPERPFPYLGEAMALTGAKDFAGARRALQAAQERLNDETRPALERRAYFIKHQIFSYETAASGKDLVAWLESVRDKIQYIFHDELALKPARELTRSDLQEIQRRVEKFPDWAGAEAAAQLRGRAYLYPLSQEAMRCVWNFPKAVSELFPWPETRAAVGLANLLLLRGHLARSNRAIDVAIRQYALAVKLGQELRHGKLVNHWAGSDMENTGIDGLEQLMEDGLINRAPLLQSLEQFVTWLATREPLIKPIEVESQVPDMGYLTIHHLYEMLMARLSIPNRERLQASGNAARARLLMLQVAVQVKKQSLTAPFPPRIDANLLPEDPFAPGQKLRYFGKGATGLIHSVGPDRADNRGAIEYDPTNGMTSPGDIILKVK